MANEILVALDGSEKGERALSTALALSELSEAGVHLVHVVQPAAKLTPIHAAFGVAPEGVAASAARARLEVETQLEVSAHDLTTRSERAISWEVIEDADVSGAIIRVAEARNVGTVVMGTRAAGATGRAIVGSVADRADDAAAAIVLATREFLVEMIAMSTRGEGGLRRLILGSIAEGVVRASEIPVLLLTPKLLAATPDESSRLVGTARP